MPESIPFNLPFIVGKELEYIAEAVGNGQLAGNGRFTRACQDLLQARYGGSRVLLTPSCTAALEMAAMLCDVGPGDEVILPSYTFVSTANAFALRGATLRFVDIRPDTLNLDPALVDAALTERTKVICPVHYAGVGCEMDALLELAGRVGARVVEDAAQGLGATYRDRCLGTIGNLGAYSFHETKNFIAGEGGALVLRDPALVERAEMLWEKGTNRAQFLLGAVDKYTWVDVGSSYTPSELVAAFLFAQLEHADEITSRRQAAWQRYWTGLHPLQEAGRLRLPVVPPDRTHNAHMFYLLLPSAGERDALLRYLAERNINAVFHYVPLHSSPMGRRLDPTPVSLPVTEDVSARLLRLPLFFDITPAQQDYIMQSIRAFVTDAPVRTADPA